MAAVLADWYGPELLLLATALRPSSPPTPASTKHPSKPTKHTAGQQQQQEEAAVPLQSLAALLQASLLPRVGRAEELSSASCVRRGLYRSNLRVWMAEGGLLAALPLELVRALALTYWQQVGRGHWLYLYLLPGTAEDFEAAQWTVTITVTVP
jgi:hypothetical protein